MCRHRRYAVIIFIFRLRDRELALRCSCVCVMLIGEELYVSRNEFSSEECVGEGGGLHQLVRVFDAEERWGRRSMRQELLLWMCVERITGFVRCVGYNEEQRSVHE